MFTNAKTKNCIKAYIGWAQTQQDLSRAHTMASALFGLQPRLSCMQSAVGVADRRGKHKSNFWSSRGHCRSIPDRAEPVLDSLVAVTARLSAWKSTSGRSRVDNDGQADYFTPCACARGKKINGKPRLQACSYCTEAGRNARMFLTQAKTWRSQD